MNFVASFIVFAGAWYYSGLFVEWIGNKFDDKYKDR